VNGRRALVLVALLVGAAAGYRFARQYGKDKETEAFGLGITVGRQFNRMAEGEQ
jgi:hypothetical protein